VTRILESFQVQSPALGRSCQMDLVEGLDSAHVDHIATVWTPLLLRQRNLAILEYFSLPQREQSKEKWNEILGKYGAPDAHWDWQVKCGSTPAANQYLFALLNGSDVEAVMLLQPGRLSRQSHQLPILYVDYLAIGPFNREPIQKPQRFRGLGTVLLGSAVNTSLNMGLEGRCGLHSLPQSEGFYRRAGMRDFDFDAAYMNLRYFEFESQAATTFIGRNQP
jgi:hypothetical protein